MTVQSRDGQGTLVMLEMPVLQQDPDEPMPSPVYAARSSTRS
jgi:hypothetical protein